MPEVYTRQSSFENGDVIDAPLFNAEFDQLEEAFRSDVGHSHNGTAGGGAAVPFIEKGTTGVYVDTSVPASPKIIFKVNGATVTTFDSTTLADTTKVTHTPNGGSPQPLNTYLDGLEIAVGDAASDAATAALSAQEASVSANEAQQAAMTLGVPVVVPDGGSYTILGTTVIANIICLGNATINLPAVLTPGYRYSIRMSSSALEGKVCTILNPTHSIIGDIRTLVAGENLTLKRKDVAILDVISSTELEII